MRTYHVFPCSVSLDKRLFADVAMPYEEGLHLAGPGMAERPSPGEAAQVND